MAITKSDVYDIQVGQPIDLRFVKTDIGARNNIPIIIRYAGLFVYTRNENKIWLWPEGATTNDDWIEANILGGVTPRVLFSIEAPLSALGDNGDIYFHDTPGGVVLYQKVAGDWGTPLGTFSKGGTVTPDSTVAYGATTSAILDGLYPTANPGDIVYNNSAAPPIQFTKLATGSWSVQIIEIA